MTTERLLKTPLRRVTTILVSLLLAACSSAPVEKHYYLLRAEAPDQTRGLSASTRYAMGKVSVAPYVDQSGLILEVAPGEVRPARHHQWAEPMVGALRSLLVSEVSRSVDADVSPAAATNAPLVFSVRIDQLHGTLDGAALLVAFWWIRAADGERWSYQFSEKRTLASDGYAALAKAQEALLIELARRIGDSLLEVDGRG